MRPNAEQIQDNWIDLVEIINNTFNGERLEKIEALHDHFKDRMLLAPASGRAWYHNAFPGCYVAHVLNIIQWSLSYYNLFKDQGMYVDDISEESVVFAAIAAPPSMPCAAPSFDALFSLFFPSFLIPVLLVFPAAAFVCPLLPFLFLFFLCVPRPFLFFPAPLIYAVFASFYTCLLNRGIFLKSKMVVS